MALLILMFLVIVCIVFTGVFWATRPTPAQTALQRRLSDSVVSQFSKPAERAALPMHLSVTEAGPFQSIDTLLSSTRLSQKLQIMIVQGQTRTTVGFLVVMTVAAFAVSSCLIYLLSSLLLLSLGIGLGISYLPYAVLRYKRAKRIAAFNAALPECIEMCARSLRVGNSLVAAIDIIAHEAVEPAKSEFAEVFKKQNYGLPLRDALLQMLDRVPSMDLQVFVTGMLVQKDTGGNLAEILDHIVAVIRERLKIKRDIRTHTAQGRLTGWILCLLPPVMLLIINLMNPGYSSVLFHEESGHKMLYAGVGLLMLGAFLIRQIVNGIEV